MVKIRKAVVPVAGLGTRFLPITKAIPKEMLPIADKPLLHHIVLELVEAGVEEIVLIVNDTKESVKKYFQKDSALEKKLKDSDKDQELKTIQQIAKLAQFKFVCQKTQSGTGDAFLCAKDIIGNEPFFGCWGDDLFVAKPKNRFQQLLETFKKYPENIVACLNDNRPESADKYGFAAGKEIKPGLIKTTSLIEKPGLKNRPSTLAVLSGFIFRPEIFKALENFPRMPHKELYHIDGLNVLREQGINTYALEIKNGRHYDCGNVSSYIKSNLELTLQNPELGPEIKKFIQTI